MTDRSPLDDLSINAPTQGHILVVDAEASEPPREGKEDTPEPTFTNGFEEINPRQQDSLSNISISSGQMPTSHRDANAAERSAAAVALTRHTSPTSQTPHATTQETPQARNKRRLSEVNDGSNDYNATQLYLSSPRAQQRRRIENPSSNVAFPSPISDRDQQLDVISTDAASASPCLASLGATDGNAPNLSRMGEAFTPIMEQQERAREYHPMAILGFQPPASSTTLNADSTWSSTTFANSVPNLGRSTAADGDSPRPRPKARRRAQNAPHTTNSMHRDALIGSTAASRTATAVTTVSSNSASSIYQSSGVQSLSQDPISTVANQLEIPPSLQLDSQVQANYRLIPRPEGYVTASSAASTSATTKAQPETNTYPYGLVPDYLSIPMMLNYPNPHINDATLQLTSFDFDPVFLDGQNQAPRGFGVAYANGQDGDGIPYEFDSLLPSIGDFPDWTLPLPDLSADPNATQYGELELGDFNASAYQNGVAQAYLNMLTAFSTQNTVFEDITEPECVNTAELWPEHCAHHANTTFYSPQPEPAASTSQLPVAQPALSQPLIEPTFHLCPFCLGKAFETENQLKRHVKHAYAGVKRGMKTRCSPPDNWRALL